MEATFEAFQLGKYRITARLGQGGFGTVYRAQDTSLGREVALKILHPQLTLPDFLQAFKQEASLAASLNHPNIVTVYELDELEGRVFLAMEYLSGGSLESHILERPYPYSEALPIFLQACAGMEELHQRGLIHRDIKPANILFNSRGTAVITDFGLAKSVMLSSASSLLGGAGTPFYKAPEIWEGDVPAGPPADVYSLGCVLYEMLMGRILFSGKTPEQVLTRHLVRGPDLAGFPPSGSPDALRAILEKALARDPQARYPTAGAFAAGLTGLQTSAETAEKARAEEEARRKLEADLRAKIEAELQQEAEEKARKQREADAADEAERTRQKEAYRQEMEEKARQREAADKKAKEEAALPALVKKEQDRQEAERRQETEAHSRPPEVFVEHGERGPRHKSVWPVILGGAVILLLCIAGVILVPRWVNQGKTRAQAQPTATQGVQPTAAPAAAQNPTAVQVAVDPSKCTKIGQTRTNEKDGMVMLCVPAGEFIMGSVNGPKDEQPTRPVYLDAYWIARTEITNAMYGKCVDSGGCTLPQQTRSSTRDDYYYNPNFAGYPVIFVTWKQASDYCRWAGVSLPTEAQWEKAARGSGGQDYPWGYDAVDSQRANYGGIIGDTVRADANPKSASPYGVLNMAGNVFEWVQDWYSETYYTGLAARNPTGPENGLQRVVRGGSWSSAPEDVRAANRYGVNPAVSYNSYGFRTVYKP
jgi:eukaryotic-like serine/threonine-protein kinase